MWNEDTASEDRVLAIEFRLVLKLMLMPILMLMIMLAPALVLLLLLVLVLLLVVVVVRDPFVHAHDYEDADEYEDEYKQFNINIPHSTIIIQRSTCNIQYPDDIIRPTTSNTQHAILHLNLRPSTSN